MFCCYIKITTFSQQYFVLYLTTIQKNLRFIINYAFRQASSLKSSVAGKILHVKFKWSQDYIYRLYVFSDSPKSSPEAWTNRQTLQDLYQNLLTMDLEYALDNKVEQDL